MFSEFTWIDHLQLSAWVSRSLQEASGKVLGGFGGYTDSKSLLENSGQESGMLNKPQYVDQFPPLKNYPSSNGSGMAKKHCVTLLFPCG